MSRPKSKKTAEEPQMGHVPGGFGGPAPPAAKGAGSGSGRGTARGLTSGRRKRRLCIFRPPLILNVRLLLGLDPLNLLELGDETTQFESIMVTKVTGKSRSETAFSAAVARRRAAARRTPR